MAELNLSINPNRHWQKAWTVMNWRCLDMSSDFYLSYMYEPTPVDWVEIYQHG